MDAPSADRAAAIEDIAYLARSPTRLDALAALTTGTHSPSELTAHTDASRPTLGRVLSEFEERGWAERTDDGYEATPAGETAVDAFDPFVERIRAIRQLGDAVGWLPTEELSIGLEHFADATVHRPDRSDPVQVSDFVTDQVRAADRFHCITHLSVTNTLGEAMLEGVAAGQLDACHVITDDLVDYLRDHGTRREWMRSYLDAGADMYRHDERIPCNLFVFDDLVILGKSYPETVHPYAGIYTEDPTVRSWALDLVARYREDGLRLEPDDFAADA